MKRIAMIFVVLVVILSTGIWLKIREQRELLNGPSGGSGTIEGQSVQITSRIPARILSVLVREGDRAQKGQVLVELECEEQLAAREAATARLSAAERTAEAARAQGEAALSAASAASANLEASGAQKKAIEATKDVSSRAAERLSKLQGEGGASVMDLDRATAQVEQLTEQIRALDAQGRAAQGQAGAAKAQAQAAKAQSEAAVAAISAARADLRRAESLVAECALKSPIDGVVLVRAFEPGEVVLPGSHLVEVAGLDLVETTFYLPNRELARAKVGGAATIVADAYPGRTFAAKIKTVASEAEFTPRNIQTRDDRDRLVYAVTLEIPNSELALRPGMPVEVTLDGSRQ
ncbi:MAG: efflux RND transporter periplasmic adaptor subunit [Deltaproteobacteria bacterium]|nr:efflux RND transporter periplasmic adaptor subunit [Deltaproteobacteria bacterium]